MKKILFCFTLLSVVPHFVHSQITNTNLSNFAFWDTEPFLAVNPVNTSNIIVGWMHATALNQLSIATKYSNDGGATWSSSVVNMPHVNSNYTSADVSIAFNNTGGAFLTYVDSRIQNDTGYVLMTKSFDGGATWSAPSFVISSTASPDFPVDRPWIAIDKTSGPYSGTIYVVNKSVDFGQMPHHIWMEKSGDNGATWSAPMLVDDSIPSDLVTNAMGALTVGNDGAVYVAYPSYHPAQSVFARMIVVKSSDGASTFTPYVIGNATANSAITDSLLQGSYSLQANPANQNDLVLVFTDNRNGDADILSSRSIDGGLTWSAPIRATDDAVSNGNNQDMCWAAYAPNGKYVTAWRDRRNSAGGSQDNFEIYATASADDGATFGTNVNMSSAQSPYINIVKGNDFIGVGTDGTDLFTAWCDYRTGNTEIFVAKTPLSSILSVNENEPQSLMLDVYPNPAGGALELNYSFSYTKKTSAEVTIMSVDGKTVLRKENISVAEGRNHERIDVTYLSSGNYLLVVKMKDGTMVEKMFTR
ncbi:MAG TPA: exo-alpha-sialidase [Bacteroidia bacterium]|jgi:hypothetical protein|nr:exo-alpha-sialidase [Bacteroidia bacterium]